MVKSHIVVAIFLSFSAFLHAQSDDTWIRVNQLGYNTNQPKVAVLGSKSLITINKFEIVDNSSGKVVFSGSPGRSFGAYGPFKDTYRLNFSSFTKNGRYLVRVGKTESPQFTISNNVYDSAADFCLRYMRQQRSGFNPFLRDSCHTYDGYTLFAPVPDSTHIDVVGGWHDATDYLQFYGYHVILKTTTVRETIHIWNTLDSVRCIVSNICQTLNRCCDNTQG